MLWPISGIGSAPCCIPQDTHFVHLMQEFPQKLKNFLRNAELVRIYNAEHGKEPDEVRLHPLLGVQVVVVSCF